MNSWKVSSFHLWMVVFFVEIKLHEIVIIVGNYGSGKTEVAVNLALYQKRAGNDVRIADLDLVNPYFRTREARFFLEKAGIDVVLPPDAYLHADLPILSPTVAGLLRRPMGLTILDVGGDAPGARVLASLSDAIQPDSNIQVLQVVNPFRPFTETIEGCLNIRNDIEAASKLTINGLIGNANLIDDTTLQEIYQGYDFLTRLSANTGIPLVFITADANFTDQLDVNQLSCPVLPIHRYLVPPWKKAASMI